MTTQNIIYILITIVSSTAAIVLLYGALFTVEEQTVAVIERFGKFIREAGPGFGLKVPFVDRIKGRVKLSILQLEVDVDTHTQDDVFIRVRTVIEYQIPRNRVMSAFYAFENVELRLTSYVLDSVRARIPKIALRDLFDRKGTIAEMIDGDLRKVMECHGYNILGTMICDIELDPETKSSISGIGTSRRMRGEAVENAETERVLKIKEAEGIAQSNALEGRGVAEQRHAIIEGLRESIGEFQKSMPEVSIDDAVNLVLMSRYFDLLKEIGSSSQSNTLIVPHLPGNLALFIDKMRDIENVMRSETKRGDLGESSKDMANAK